MDILEKLDWFLVTELFSDKVNLTNFTASPDNNLFKSYFNAGGISWRCIVMRFNGNTLAISFNRANSEEDDFERIPDFKRAISVIIAGVCTTIEKIFNKFEDLGAPEIITVLNWTTQTEKLRDLYDSDLFKKILGKRFPEFKFKRKFEGIGKNGEPEWGWVYRRWSTR